MKILGISAYYHDSAAALVIDGEIICAAQEERFTRIKHTADFPANAIQFCLKEAGLALHDVDAIVFYDKPFLKFERLLETYMAFAPRGLFSFLKAIPLWIKEKLFLKRNIINELNEIGVFDKSRTRLLFTEHHLSHAASAFYPSPFSEAAILTIDGVGEWCTTSLARGKGNDITFLKEINFPHSVGLLYSAFTYYLGFTVNSGEYKLMGLAPYGNKDSKQVKTFITLIKKHLVTIHEDGSIWLNQHYFNYAVGLTMANNNKWEQLFGFKRREEEEELHDAHCNLALAIQLVTEEIVIKLATHLKTITNARYLCMAGGVALNCVANGKLKQLNLFNDIFIQPAAGDSGGALGAALAASYIYFDTQRITDGPCDTMKGAYLGPAFSDKTIELMCTDVKANYTKPPDFKDVCTQVAGLISEGNIVGWFQDKMEFGPRALGNRSILADPGNPEMQKKLNLKIKNREGFRPFAPSVLEEDVQNYFECDTPSPYMLLTFPVKKEIRKAIPGNYHSLGFWDKLYYERSSIPSVTHIDFSARVQTVSPQTNPKFHQLISCFKAITNKGVLINTSFNVRGEPIVCTPMDAYRCFMSTDMDYLVINNYIFAKQSQSDWKNKDKWITHFKKD